MSDTGVITFVNRFTLNGSPEDFERAFSQTADFMHRQPGLLSYTLSRDVDRPDNYVNIALWDSAQSLRGAAAHPDFHQHVTTLRAMATSESALYTERLAFVAGPSTAGPR